jgi:hypothetical protein
MKQLIDIINEKLILSKNNISTDNIVLFTDKIHPEKIMDVLDNLFGRRNHNINIDIHNYKQDAYKDYTTSFTYETIDDVLKLCCLFELLFGVSYYGGDFDDTEDMAYFIRDSKLIREIGGKHQTKLDQYIQDCDDIWTEIYNKFLRQ